MARILNDQIKEKLKKHYYDIGYPGSFGGVERLSKASGISSKITKERLLSQDAYTLHKPVRFKFTRRKVLAFGIGDLMQCDLVDMSKLSRYNRGIKYLLTCIDVFSKYAYVIPLKNKNANSVLEAFKKLFHQMKYVVMNVQTDFGKEFHNKKVCDYFKKHNINHYSTHSEFKASVIERFNRTLKNKLFRIFTHTNSYRYLNNLKLVLKSYNVSKHRTTGYAPIDVTPDLEPIIFENVYGYKAETNFKYNIGDKVRISKAKRTFRKGYLSEVFRIYKRYGTIPTTYLLQDLKGTIIKGRFYEQELQKIIKPNQAFWRVEKILKTRGTGVNKEYFVKWTGFDSRFNSWIKNSWLKKKWMK